MCSFMACVQQVEQAPRSVSLITQEELGTMTVLAIVLSCVILGCCASVGLIAWLRRHMHDKVRGPCSHSFPLLILVWICHV